jgi:uncharacterized protein (TIGR02246 family)
MKVVAGLLLAGGLALMAGCGSSRPTLRDVEPLTEQWEAIFNTRDVEALLGLYTADTRVMPPNTQPLLGLEAVRTYYENVLANDVEINLMMGGVLAEEELAHTSGSYLLLEEGRMIDRGNWAITLKVEEEEERQWRIHRHIWNSDLNPEDIASVLKPRLQVLADRFAQAYGRRDADVLAGLFTDGAMLLPPNMEPQVGQEALRAYYRTVEVPSGVRVKMEVGEVIALGREARASGTMTLLGEGQAVHDRSHWSGVLVEDGDNWRFQRLLWSNEQPVRLTSSAVTRAAVEEANRRFMDAVGRGDASLLADLYTEDARVLPPNRPLVQGGRAAEQFWQSLLDTGLSEMDLESLEVAGLGDLLYDVGQYEMRGEVGQVLDRGKYLFIWRWEDGEWLMHRNIWNSNIPIPMRTAPVVTPPPSDSTTVPLLDSEDAPSVDTTHTGRP